MLPELWTIVFENYGSNLEDLIYLWTQCCQVSKQLKRDVENTLIRQHLPAITLTIGFQRRVSYSTCDFFETEYIGVSEDRKTALFSAPAASQKEILNKTQMTKGQIHYWGLHHYAYTRALTNRVPIPCCFVLKDEGELVFRTDWQKLLDAILQEGKRCLKPSESRR